MMSITILSSCTNTSGGNNEPPVDPTPDPVIINTVETHKMLEGTNDETTVYIIRSNGGGPKVAIIGGTHGDEEAGWKAALLLKDKRDYLGDILIIPQCNIQADLRLERYAGLGKTAVNGVYYSDLNRSYPGYTKTPKPATKAISDAILAEIESFGADHIIDLHESKKSVTEMDENGGLGNCLIYGNFNSSWPALEIVEEFNNTYKLEGEDDFYTETDAPAGSYNYYFGNLFPDSLIFTTETNRDVNKTKGLTLDRRIEQQIQLVTLILKYINTNYWPQN